MAAGLASGMVERASSPPTRRQPRSHAATDRPTTTATAAERAEQQPTVRLKCAVPASRCAPSPAVWLNCAPLLLRSEERAAVHGLGGDQVSLRLAS